MYRCHPQETLFQEITNLFAHMYGQNPKIGLTNQNVCDTDCMNFQILIIDSNIMLHLCFHLSF